MHICAEVSTKNRYNTTLPLTLVSIANQTRKPDELLIFDDGDHRDLREIPIYQYIFRLLDEKRISWKVLFGEGKGQHYCHEKAQEMAKELIWRIDDDEIAEPNVLEELEKNMAEAVGAVGGLVLDPKNTIIGISTGKIENINTEPNMQWLQNGSGEVEHLYSSFLFRKGIANYNLKLSNVAHREETMFTHEIFKKGYKLIVAPVVTWHFRNPEGGIRGGKREDWEHDERIFQKWLGIKDTKIAILDNGLGDHIVFRKMLDDLNIKNITLAVCYPEVFEGFNLISIATAKELGYETDKYNIYQWMDKQKWKGDLYGAFKKFYEDTLTS